MFETKEEILKCLNEARVGVMKTHVAEDEIVLFNADVIIIKPDHVTDIISSKGKLSESLFIELINDCIINKYDIMVPFHLDEQKMM